MDGQAGKKAVEGKEKQKMKSDGGVGDVTSTQNNLRRDNLTEMRYSNRPN